MSKKNYRRSIVVNAVAPAGGAIISGCPERSDLQFEQGTAAGTAAHSAAVRAWIKSNLCDAGSELRTVDQKDRNVMLFNDWLEQSGYEPFADWVQDADGWRVACRFDDEQKPQVPTAESLIEYAFKMANGDGKKYPKGGRPEYRNGDWCAAVNRTPADSNATWLHGTARAGTSHSFQGFRTNWHVIVCSAFHGENPYESATVDHINGDVADNL